MINQQATAGIIIASSILISRALAPVELAIANWQRLRRGPPELAPAERTCSARMPGRASRMELPPPEQTLDGRGGQHRRRPARNRLVVQDVAFQLKAGQGLGIIGPSASGKSSLVRALVGVWPAAARQGPPRRRRARPVDAGDARPRISATCRRTSSCSPAPSPRTSPASSPTRDVRSGDRGGQGGRRARADPAPAGRLRDPIGEGGAALSAGQRQRIGAGPRALRRSVPGGARRAQLQPRRRGRRGADPGDPRRARARRHRRRGRPPARARWPASTGAGHGRRPPQAFGPKDEVLQARAAAGAGGSRRPRSRLRPRR